MEEKTPPPRPPLMPLDAALEALLAHVEPSVETQLVSTMEADGRVLAQDVVSSLSVPAADNSSMDGYALRRSDVGRAGTELPVSQRIAAGSVGAPLAPGTVARIFTGAPVPDGADCIVMQEDVTVVGEDRVRIDAVPKAGQWIRRAGEDIAPRSRVLERGTLLDPASIGLAASVGVARLKVSLRPRVALFSTGDELVMPGDVAPQAMKPGAIYNSNRFFLRALLRRAGCVVTDFGIVPDKRGMTISALSVASRNHELILTSGGVSVGEEDHIKPAVESLGHLDLWQIAIKPGKPCAYGKVGSTHFIGLPGNPVSSFVTFLLLVRPFLLKLQGASRLDPPRISLPAHFDWPRPDRRREFLRVRRNAEAGLDLFPNQSSGVLTSMAWGDGLVDVAAGRTIEKGDGVPFIAFSDLLQ